MNITLKNVPDKVYRTVKQAAKEQGRSLNAQIIRTLEAEAAELERRKKLSELKGVGPVLQLSSADGRQRASNSPGKAAALTVETLVVDCSVAAKWVLHEADSATALHLLDQQESGRVLLIAPDLLLIEFASLIAKRTRREQMAGPRSRSGFPADGGS